VTDTVGVLSPATRESLARQLEAYEGRTGHQVLVWIGATTGDAPIEDFAVKTFEKWKVGRAAKDDGLVLFVLTEDRKLRLEVGYGLEDKVTDLLASRIIREVMAPRLQQNDPNGAITAGVAAILSTIDAGGFEAATGTAPPETPLAPMRRAEARPLSLGQKLLFGLIGLGLLFFFITNPSLAIWLLLNILSGGGGRSGGGYSGGGGGFGGGGGGRSGGGGASGSW
jgi:uncharacterized protein